MAVDHVYHARLALISLAVDHVHHTGLALVRLADGSYLDLASVVRQPPVEKDGHRVD